MSSAAAVRAFSVASDVSRSASARASASACSASVFSASASLVASPTSRAISDLAVRVRCSFCDSAAGQPLDRGLLRLGEDLLGLQSGLAQLRLGLLHALLGGPVQLGGLLPGLLGLRVRRRTQLLGVAGGLLRLVGRGVEQPLGVLAGAQQDRLGLGAGGLRLGAEPLPGLVREPDGLRAGGGQGLLGLGPRLVEQPHGPGTRSGPAAARPRRRSR